VVQFRLKYDNIVDKQFFRLDRGGNFSFMRPKKTHNVIPIFGNNKPPVAEEKFVKTVVVV